MKQKKFRGNTPPPITAGIRRMSLRSVPGGTAPKGTFSQRPWRDKALRRHVFYIEGEAMWQCYLCGDALTLRMVTVDHVQPLSKGGTCHVSNLRPCCRSCNNAKGDSLPTPAPDRHEG